MISETEKYNRNLEEFSKLISYGTDLSNSLIGLRPESTNQLYGERIFVKLLCHGMTLVKISPAKEPKVDRELWDISSSYAVSRALVETFDALSYISLANITEREQEFRILFWTLHAEARRFDMLSKIGSNDPRVNKIKQDVETTKDQVINHSCIEMCPAHIKANIEKGKYQPYHLTQKQRNDEASISHEYHNTGKSVV